MLPSLRDASLPDFPIQLCKALLSLPSVSGTEGEDVAFGAIRLWLSKIRGVDVAVAADETALIASTRKVEEGEPALGFVCHIDVVPVGDSDSWDSPPFGPRCVTYGKKGQEIVARGASDMKSGLAAAITTLIGAANEGTACFLVVTKGEETACVGAPAAAELIESLNINVRGLIVAESSGNVIKCGHRGAVWLQLVSHGVAAHGSTPQLGVNAITKMQKALAQLAQLPLLSHESLGEETVNIGTIQGGTAPNIVPDECVATLDFRVVKDRASELKRQCEALDGIDEVRVVCDLAPVWSDPENEWIAQLPGKRDREPVAYYTDASVLVHTLPDTPIVIWGPGDPRMVHSANESVSCAAIIEAVRGYQKALSL